RKPFTIKFTEPPQVFTYALLQEKATLLYYKQLHQTIEEPVLKFILRLLIKDEARHFAFFASVVGAYIEQFGEQVMPHIKAVVADFKMPLHNTLRNYWRQALVVCDAADGYRHTDAYEDLVKLIHKFANAATCTQTAELVNLVHQLRAA
ncbi:MAG TPA: acyl-ACP desaturase, partial [Candidatus Caenarcaniphilales bacterium]